MRCFPMPHFTGLGTGTCNQRNRALLKPEGRFVAEFGGEGNIGKLVAAAERAWISLKFLSRCQTHGITPICPNTQDFLKITDWLCHMQFYLIVRLPWKRASTVSIIGCGCSAARFSTAFPKVIEIDLLIARWAKQGPNSLTASNG